MIAFGLSCGKCCVRSLFRVASGYLAVRHRGSDAVLGSGWYNGGGAAGLLVFGPTRRVGVGGGRWAPRSDAPPWWLTEASDRGRSGLALAVGGTDTSLCEVGGLFADISVGASVNGGLDRCWAPDEPVSLGAAVCRSVQPAGRRKAGRGRQHSHRDAAFACLNTHPGERTVTGQPLVCANDTQKPRLRGPLADTPIDRSFHG